MLFIASSAFELALKHTSCTEAGEAVPRVLYFSAKTPEAFSRTIAEVIQNKA
jgi:hypothetical protein